MATSWARFRSQTLWTHHRRRHVGKWEALLLGGAGSALVHSAPAPLERVELLLRVKTEFAPAPQPRKFQQFDPGSAVECCDEIMAREGWRGFWRGNVVAVVRFVPIQVIDSIAKDCCDWLLAPSGEAPFFTRAVCRVVSGRLARGVVSVCAFPMEVLLCRCRCQGLDGQGAAARDTRGWFDGLGMHTFGSIVGRDVRFLLQLLANRSRRPSSPAP